jgi:hypothetical protein
MEGSSLRAIILGDAPPLSTYLGIIWLVGFGLGQCGFPFIHPLFGVVKVCLYGRVFFEEFG